MLYKAKNIAILFSDALLQSMLWWRIIQTGQSSLVTECKRV